MIVVSNNTKREYVFNDEMKNILDKYRWFEEKDSGYLYTWLDGKTIYAHRLIFGDISIGVKVEHVDNDPTNNLINNMKISPKPQDLSTQKPFIGKSIYKGVYFDDENKKWFVRIDENIFGYYENELSAAKYYDLVAKELHGAYAYQNFEMEEKLL